MKVVQGLVASLMGIKGVRIKGVRIKGVRVIDLAFAKSEIGEH